MIRVSIDGTVRDGLHALRRSALPAKVRDRVEMVLSSDAGWSAPRIATHLGYCGHTVRGILRDFNARGMPALYPRKTGPAPDAAKRERVTGHLRRLLGEDRTWAAGQLSDALHPHGIRLGPRQVRRYLRVLKAGYRRTASTLEHKQDPAKVARASVPRVVVLDNASLHVSKVVKARRRELASRGIFLYYLPAYSPELNRIEPVFRQVKYQEIPVRSYTSKPALREAVEPGFSSYAGRLAPKKSGQQLRPAA